MKKSKQNSPVVITECGDPDFNWDLYKNGYNGVSLTINKDVKCNSHKERVYSQEPYAQELYYLYMKKNPTIQQKDFISGSVYMISDITPISDHEVSISMDNGMSDIIDLIKEHTFIHDYIGCQSIEVFLNNIKDLDYKKALLANNIKVKVNENGRLSISEGVRSRIESEFAEEIRLNTCKYAYNAVVKEINHGGYIVDIMGLKCFLPGSLAAPGIITDFETLMGKTIPVMPINYMPNSGFVVSYKKYLNAILPDKIKNELHIGKHVSVKVTGTSKNGIFVIFKDNNDEYVFNGLVHRSVMSSDFENEFNRHMFNINDEFWAYIVAINEAEDGTYRIVLSDQNPVNIKPGEGNLQLPDSSEK